MHIHILYCIFFFNVKYSTFLAEEKHNLFKLNLYLVGLICFILSEIFFFISNTFIRLSIYIFYILHAKLHFYRRYDLPSKTRTQSVLFGY